MKTALAGAAWIGLAALSGNVSLLAQSNDERQLTCENGGYDSQRARHCLMREQSAAAIGSLTVDASPNGGVTVKGAPRGDVMVRARVDAWADNDSAASFLASQVFIDTSGGQVRATGPQSLNNSGWSVSYEILVPQNMDLNLKSRNGGLTVSDVRGQIRFDVTNGGVRLRRVAGDVMGATVNGGIQVDLAGATWDGRQLDLRTNNGGVTVAMPTQYSAHIQAETGMGGIQSDFPVALDSNNTRPRRLDYQMGAGGGLIHIVTGNGSVRLKRAEAQ
jgi:DUF4097 and DUF4098 domain-containing protein YvlB